MEYCNDIKKLYECNKCNIYFTCYKTLWQHNKKKHFILNNTIVKQHYYCNFCNRLFNHYQNRWKHEKICKSNTKLDITNKENIEIKKLEIEKINAEKELIKFKIKLINGTKLDIKTFKSVNKILMTRSYYKHSHNNNNIIINNIQNNIQNNINLIGFGKEKIIDKLSSKDKKLIIKSGFLCLEKITEITNIGSYNEFKSIVITNLKDNFAYQYNEKLGYFVIVNKNDTINELICNRVMDIEAIYDELESANKIDEKTKKIIQNFLIKIECPEKFIDEQENITYTNYKDYKIHNIKILLYNNHDKITKDIALFISNS